MNDGLTEPGEDPQPSAVGGDVLFAPDNQTTLPVVAFPAESGDNTAGTSNRAAAPVLAFPADGADTTPQPLPDAAPAVEIFPVEGSDQTFVADNQTALAASILSTEGSDVTHAITQRVSLSGPVFARASKRSLFAPRRNYILRCWLAAMRIWRCVQDCSGEIIGTLRMARVTKEDIRGAVPSAQATIVMNGAQTTRIYEANTLIGILSPNECRRLPMSGLLRLSAETLLGASVMHIATYKRCDCSHPETDEVIPPPVDAFDYAVLRYTWIAGNGTDLDTRTAVLEPALLNDVGWSRHQSDPDAQGAANSYLYWGGDNTTPAGNEAVLVNFQKLQEAYPDLEQFVIRLRARWYSTRVNGDVTISITTYIGGVMTPSGLDFVNSGGTLVSSQSMVVNITERGPANGDGQDAGTLVYSVASQTAELVPA